MQAEHPNALLRTDPVIKATPSTPCCYASHNELQTHTATTTKHPPPHTQIPIIKATLQFTVEGRPVRIHADISYGAMNGAAAVRYMVRQVSANGSSLLFSLQIQRLAAMQLDSCRSASGPDTHHAQTQVSALPPLRPLVLAAKALLKEAGLNGVCTDGLHSQTCNLEHTTPHRSLRCRRCARWCLPRKPC